MVGRPCHGPFFLLSQNLHIAYVIISVNAGRSGNGFVPEHSSTYMLICGGLHMEKKIYHQNSGLAEKLRKNANEQEKVDTGKIGGSLYGSMDSAAHNEQMLRFNARQGQGFAAEQANDLIDSMGGKNAQIVGNDNAKNGADRLVDGMLIQSKYCQTAQASVNAAFNPQTKYYRYIDRNGTPMQLEVPSDQYNEAVQLMRRKIAEGKVPGVKDPDAATKLVRKGNVTYQQACNIAKAGTIDSLVFDATHGAVIAKSAFGISAVITFARSMWSGQSVEQSIDNAMYVGLQCGGAAFISSVISAQLTRTSLNAAIQQPVIGAIKALPPAIRKSLVSAMKNGALFYGRGTAGNLAKLWSSNIITSAVFTIVLSASDISHFFSGKISGKQLFKNVTTLGVSMGGTYAGAAAGGALGGPAGAIIGGIAGGMLAGKGADSVLGHFIEDDAVAMVRILNDRFVVLAQEYLLDEEEVNLVLEDLNVQLVQDKLLQMFASKDRKQFADELLREIIDKIVRLRTRILIPENSDFMEGLGRILELGKNPVALQNHLKGIQVDTVAMGKQLLGRDISKHAADKAWYATKQMNLVGLQQEMFLSRMKRDEERHTEKVRRQEKELTELKNALDELVEE